MLEKKRAKLKNPYAVDSGQLRQLSIEEVEASLRQLSANLPSAAPGVGPSADPSNNAYSKLVERIKEHHKASNPATPSPSPPPPAAALLEPAAADNPAESAESAPSVEEVMVQVPPEDLMMLIDRTASYVCRQNLEFGHQKGADKIGVVKKLHKDKFSFLFPEDKYNTYYLFKVALYTEMYEKKRIVADNEYERPWRIWLRTPKE